VVDHAKRQLLEVILAFRAPRSLTRSLHCGQQKRNQDSDNGDDDQKFDKRETISTTHRMLLR
jgi:hypothetical protein